jgi:anti-sigma factor RsiW
MTSECAEIRQSLGVYVVGAIDPAERSIVDRHLGACSACRDELAGLAGLPALLSRVSLAEVEDGLANGAAVAPPPPERLLHSMLAEMSRRRGAGRRRAVLALAASFVLLAGVGAGAQALYSSLSSRPAPVSASPNWRAVSARSTATGVGATVKFQPRQWGTVMDVWVTGISRGTWCQLWVTDSTGRLAPAGSWQVPYEGGGNWYPGSTSVALASIKSFEITSRGQMLVTVPAAG